MNTAILASGSGTILQAFLAAGVEVELVVVDRPCNATAIAEKHDVKSLTFSRPFDASFDRDSWTRSVTQALTDSEIELVVMAGFGTIFGAPIYEHYAGRILNTHPSLLPSFPGWHAVDDALSYGVKVTGCTVHVAELEVDAGPILAQAPVLVRPDDTAATLHERIKEVERDLYIATVQDILSNGMLSEESP